ncbi:unnamed protein product, partial [Cyprideis torosa]
MNNPGGGPPRGGNSQAPKRPPVNQAALQKIFIQRDYSEGTAVQFQSSFPPELEGRISSEIFERTLSEINGIFAEAESLSCATYWHSCLACLTGYLSLLCCDTGYEK